MFDYIGDGRWNGHLINGRINTVGWVSSIHELTTPTGTDILPIGVPANSGLGWYHTIVCQQDAEMMSVEMQQGYSAKAFMSYDGIFRPVSMDGDGGLPQFCNAPEPSGLDTITIHDLNPWTNPSGMARDYIVRRRSDTPNVGHDLQMVARVGTDYENAPSGGLDMYQSWVTQTSGEGEYRADYTNDYRFMALKGPLVIHGWGYDCSGVPIPNKNDVEEDANSGVFITNGLHSTKFLDDHLKKPHTWPVAPVDLRFDRERCVWTACGTGIGSVDCEGLKNSFNYPDDDNDGLPDDGYRYIPVFETDGTCQVTRLVKCGDIIKPTGEVCAGCGSEITPLGFNLAIDSVTFSPNDDPNANITLIQQGDNCTFEGDQTLKNNGGTNEVFTWELKFTSGAPGTWDLRLKDASETTIISFDAINEGLFNCQGANDFTWDSTTASELDSNYNYSTGTFCAEV